MMKTVIAFSALVATASAFVPAVSRPAAFALKAAAEETYTQAQKEKIIEDVFECHGFFPDLRDDSELPAEVIAMRKQPKSKAELAEIKEKYAAIKDDSDRAFAMLVDLGLMEDYDKLGEYDDNFADDAM